MTTDNILVAVSAYAGDQHQVENNLSVYLHHGFKVMVLSPADAPIINLSDPAVICMSAGRACWAGKEALNRHIKFMEILADTRYEYFLFNDADSFCLAEQLPAYLSEDVIWSNEVRDTNPGASMLPKIAMQPPYFFSRRALAGMLATKDHLPTSYYGEQKTPEGWPLPIPTECPDHLMLQLAHGSGFAHKSFFTGASFETASGIGQETMAALVRQRGFVFLHSIKEKHVLERLKMERKEYLRTH